MVDSIGSMPPFVKGQHEIRGVVPALGRYTEAPLQERPGHGELGGKIDELLSLRDLYHWDYGPSGKQRSVPLENQTFIIFPHL